MCIRDRGSASRIVLTTVAALIAALFILPAVWILVGSFRPNLDIVSTMSPLSWHLIVPSRVTFDNYVVIMTDGGFALALLNSLVVCMVSVAVGLFISTMAGYALAVFN